ncbi:MAG: FHA domain-containing serine/threonine-protein kinase [Vulcanisaeta sp.]
MLKPGIKFRDYVVVRELGGGGMSYVWLARRLDSGEHFVVKEPIIREDDLQSTRLNIEKIRHEARVLKILRHRNIVSLIEAFEVLRTVSGVDLNPVILILEYIDGPSLDSFVRSNRPSIGTAIEIMKQLCDAVSFMHRNNVIHRDIKPKNILVIRKENIVKLIDFGTSRYYYDQPMSNEAIISPGGYTAPEQRRFLSSPQSDIWSLGAVLYFLVTGRDPEYDMPGYPDNVIAPPDPRKYNEDVDERIVKVIQRAMDPVMSNRYLTAGDMLRDLLGGEVRAAETPVSLVIKGVKYDVNSDVIILGRNDISNATEFYYRGGEALIEIYDENKFISKRHCMIFRKDGKWFLKDLGSLNRTAVYRDGRWIEVYRGYKQESPEFELRDGDILALAYDVNKGPYLQILFKVNPGTG